jgi:hypothetical protein
MESIDTEILAPFSNVFSRSVTIPAFLSISSHLPPRGTSNVTGHAILDVSANR